MDESRFDYEYYNNTMLHPLAGVAIAVLGVALLLVPRRFAVVPMILIACFISPAQRISIATLDFNLLRIMVVFGWMRLMLTGEYREFRWRGLDTLVILWSISGTLAYVALRGEFSALVYRLGTSFDAAGMYFFFRCVVRSWRDLQTTVLSFIVIAIPIALAFLIEWRTARNLFAVFGGVWPFTLEREGRLRCQGAFAHPILAGCFWVSLLPLFASQFWRGGRYRAYGFVGICAALMVIVACASSTPIAAIGLCLIGALFVKLRRHMRAVRWIILGTLVVLHLVMKAPVWHLISRIDLVGGSTGWHRYILIDQAIKRVGEWGLFGTHSTAHWGHHLFDITNQYILEGVQGGLVTLAFFIAIISVAFAYVGRMVRAAEGNKAMLATSWALGTTLFAHCMIFLGVSYFGQIIMLWYLLLAVITSLSPATAAVPVRATPARPRRAAPGATIRRDPVPPNPNPELP